MQDAYGDGWNKAKITVTFDGIAGGTIELNDKAKWQPTLAFPNGSVVDFIFNKGDWDEEVSFQIFNAQGTQVYSITDATNLLTGSFYKVTNTCP